MDEPGVYFTLDAPFVSIIGLYTNALEGPGIISPRKLESSEAVERSTLRSWNSSRASSYA
jgi:hypothetical protein